MYKRAILVFVAIVLAFGCEEISNLLTFEFNDRANFTIASGLPLGAPLSMPTPSVTSSSTKEFENNNTSADLVRDVKLKQLKLTITQPTGQTFSFLNTIRIFISADGVSEIELAALENISTTSGTIDLIPTTEKLDAFVKAPSYELRTQVTTDEALAEDVEVQVDLKFQVTADAF